MPSRILKLNLRTFLVGTIALTAAMPLSARSLAEYARTNEIKLFVPTKGAVMPNHLDNPGHLKLDTPALLLSGLDLTDLTGISRLMVEYQGRKVPVTSVKKLFVYLNANGLTELPDEIGELKNVIFLYLERNRLSSLPRGFLGLENLVAVYFTENEFTEIPRLIYEMTWLSKLQFSWNRITELPADIGRLNELRHFNIAGNRIEVLPDSIARMTKIRVCDFSDNPIRVIPESFGDVGIVNQLRIRNTNLTTLPAGFAAMRATIDITGSKIDPARLPASLQAKINVEKPPGSKDDEPVVLKPQKS